MRPEFDPETWPLVAEVMQLEEALMIADYLRQTGIEAYIESPAMISPVGGYLQPMTRVYVSQENQAGANQALAEFYEDDPDFSDEDTGEAP
jgi:hypothetical protein